MQKQTIMHGPRKSGVDAVPLYTGIGRKKLVNSSSKVGFGGQAGVHSDEIDEQDV
jgi:hypothetical protein